MLRIINGVPTPKVFVNVTGVDEGILIITEENGTVRTTKNFAYLRNGYVYSIIVGDIIETIILEER